MKIFHEVPLTVKFFLLGLSSQKLKEYPVYARIIYRRQKAEISMKITAKVSDWDKGAGMFKGTKQNNLYNNHHLIDARKRIIDIYDGLKRGRLPISVQTISKIFRGKASDHPETTLIEFFDRQVEEKKQRPAEFSKGTIQQYARTRTHLVNYLKTNGLIAIRLNELSLNFIVSFEHYLLSNKLKSIGRAMNRASANTCIKKLKAVVMDALKKEVLERNPFISFKMKKAKNGRIIYLTAEELKALKDLDLSHNASLTRVRDTFLAAVYTGLRFGDLNTLTLSHLKTDKMNKVWLFREMHKTKEIIEVPMLQEALRLFEKYKEECAPLNRVLPPISNQKLNAYLKVLANMAGIQKKLHTHVARHTFATLCLETLPLKTVSILLGHRSIKSTEVYAQVTKRSLSDSVDKLDLAAK